MLPEGGRFQLGIVSSLRSARKIRLIIFVYSMAVAAGVTSGFPEFTITVNDTNPIWAYVSFTKLHLCYSVL